MMDNRIRLFDILVKIDDVHVSSEFRQENYQYYQIISNMTSICRDA